LALPPITDHRMTPPVDSIGDKRLERSRRDFMDLIRSDEQKHESGSQRRNREQQANDQEAQAQDAQRQTRIATDRNRDRMRMVNVPANANQFHQQRPAAPPRQDNASRQIQRTGPQGNAAVATNAPRPAGSEARDLQRPSPTGRAIVDAPIIPVLRRDPEARDNHSPATLRAQPASQQVPPRDSAAQVSANGIRPRQDGVARSDVRPEPRSENVAGAVAAPARSRWPEPPAGSSLVAASPAAGALNLVAPGALEHTASELRLSREVPREVADRISQFLRTGIINRAPFRFPQMATVIEAISADAAEPVGVEKPATALGALSSSLMRASLGKLAARPQTVDDLVARQSGVKAEIPEPVQDAVGQPAQNPVQTIAPMSSSARELASSRDLAPGKAAARAASPIMLASLGEHSRKAADLGVANPFFGTRPSSVGRSPEREGDVVVDLIAGPRSQVRRDRIA
jgi:hypothetical protein